MPAPSLPVVTVTPATCPGFTPPSTRNEPVKIAQEKAAALGERSPVFETLSGETNTSGRVVLPGDPKLIQRVLKRQTLSNRQKALQARFMPKSKSNVYKHYDCLRIINLTFHKDDKTGELDPSRISVTVDAKLPQFLMEVDPDTGENLDYALSTTSVIYTDIIRLAALLKAAGEMALADAAVNSPKLLLSILKGATISLFGRKYSEGDIEQNPFSSRINTYECIHDLIRYYPYDIELGEAGKRISAQADTIMLQRALGI